MILLIIGCLFSISIQANPKLLNLYKHIDKTILEKNNQINSFELFLEDLQPQIISGEKKKLKQAVIQLIDYLHSSEKEFISPSKSKMSVTDFSKLIALLHSKQIESSSSVFIYIGELYFYSAIKNYNQLRKILHLPKQKEKNSFGDLLLEKAVYQLHSLQNNRSEMVYENPKIEKQKHLFNELIFERVQYLVIQKDQVSSINREWQLALMFFSLSGFDSSEAKNKYIYSLHQYQRFYNSILQIYKKHELLPGHSTIRKNNHLIKNNLETEGVSYYELEKETSYLHTIRNFKSMFENMKQFYLDFIIPSFENLSWINKDLKKYNHPEMLFEYGRILNTINTDQGLKYLQKAEEKNYWPVIDYFMETYHEQRPMTKLNIKYALHKYLKEKKLKESLTLDKKLKIASALLSIDTANEENPLTALKKGTISLKHSCQSLFTKKL